jgi:hypothetical protein
LRLVLAHCASLCDIVSGVGWRLFDRSIISTLLFLNEPCVAH